MPNLVQIADHLKGVPDAFLQQEAQQPSGLAPPYLVLGEISRRKALREQAPQAPTTTVYDDLLGQPQGQPGMQQPGMPPGMPSPMSGIDSLTPGQPPPMPGGPPMGPPQQMPQDQGLGSQMQNMPPPMQQGAQRYAKGGVIRMAGGDVVSLPDYLRAPTRNYDDFIKNYKWPEYPEFKWDYKPPEPYKIKLPDYDAILERVRAKARDEQSTTVPLENRVRELEQERGRIRQPNLGDILLETGMGMMASQSPYAAQSLGAAGLGAMHNYQKRADNAEERRITVADRLAQLRAQIAREQGERRRESYDIANSIYNREAGAASTAAQVEMNARSQEASNQREMLQARSAAEREKYRGETGKAEKIFDLLGKHGDLPPDLQDNALLRRIYLYRQQEKAQQDYPTARDVNPWNRPEYTATHNRDYLHNQAEWVVKDILGKHPELTFDEARKMASTNVQDLRWFTDWDNLQRGTVAGAARNVELSPTEMSAYKKAHAAAIAQKAIDEANEKERKRKEAEAAAAAATARSGRTGFGTAPHENAPVFDYGGGTYRRSPPASDPYRYNK